MGASALYLPKYVESRALIIGINSYQHVSPLIHACNDAKAVAQMLVDQFIFPKKNIELLLDANATRDSILRAYLSFANSEVIGTDDRILVFFAGHGHTLSGRRGETGFLVPVDGKPDDLASLIRWDQLTLNADLVPAKHMLFLMDACYGGLALTRTTIPPGSMRFLKDMLQRYARQVLTAGKPDEAVADSGGTRAGHSIFTSYLLDGMEGAAVPTGGILTGHGLMAYVHDKVGTDVHSRQTPHFGFFDGDGDFIFDTSVLAELEPKPSSEPEPDIDVLIKAPSFAPPAVPQEDSVADDLKRLIASPAEKIRLNDYISSLIRRAQDGLSQDKFPPSAPVTNEELASRLQRYEDAIGDLLIAAVLLAHWGESEQIKLLEKIFARIAEAEKATSGKTLWLKLSWYPVLLLMYGAGISAIAAGRYDALRATLLTTVHPDPISGRSTFPIILPVIQNLTEILDAFKQLPNMERKYVPRSEHIFKKLQPVLEDQLFLGRGYESFFDQFEIFLALTYADIRDEDVSRHVWGPPGRFAWKERGIAEDLVYSRFVSEAKAEGERWKPLQAGLFKNSPERFSDVADAYGKLLSRINWW